MNVGGFISTLRFKARKRIRSRVQPALLLRVEQLEDLVCPSVCVAVQDETVFCSDYVENEANWAVETVQTEVTAVVDSASGFANGLPARVSGDIEGFESSGTTSAENAEYYADSSATAAQASPSAYVDARATEIDNKVEQINVDTQESAAEDVQAWEERATEIQEWDDAAIAEATYYADDYLTWAPEWVEELPDAVTEDATWIVDEVVLGQVEVSSNRNAAEQANDGWNAHSIFLACTTKLGAEANGAEAGGSLNQAAALEFCGKAANQLTVDALKEALKKVVTDTIELLSDFPNEVKDKVTEWFIDSLNNWLNDGQVSVYVTTWTDPNNPNNTVTIVSVYDPKTGEYGVVYIGSIVTEGGEKIDFVFQQTGITDENGIGRPMLTVIKPKD